MFSGCKDSQTSADAYIGGKHVGGSTLKALIIANTNSCRCHVMGVPGDYERRLQLGHVICSSKSLQPRNSSLLILDRFCRTQGIICSRIIPKFLNYPVGISST